MSKYIKLEDAINTIEDKIAEYIPVLYGRYCEMPLEIRMAIEHLPTIEVSEDCISRAWVQNKLTEYVKDYALNELDSWQNTIVEWIATDIEDAPSVVPKARPIEMHLDVTDDVVDRAVEQIRAEGKWIKEKRGG